MRLAQVAVSVYVLEVLNSIPPSYLGEGLLRKWLMDWRWATNNEVRAYSSDERSALVRE
jgi:hypothetical protein